MCALCQRIGTKNQLTWSVIARQKWNTCTYCISVRHNTIFNEVKFIYISFFFFFYLFSSNNVMFYEYKCSNIQVQYVECSHEYGWWWDDYCSTTTIFRILCWFNDTQLQKNTHSHMLMCEFWYVCIEIEKRPYETNTKIYVIITAKKKRRRQTCYSKKTNLFSLSLFA